MQACHSTETTNLPSGTRVPSGIYVVSHYAPAHAPPHEVLIPATMILPGCNVCAGVRFSLQTMAVPIAEHKFFWPSAFSSSEGSGR